VCLYIYTYIYIVSVCVCMYIYIYIYYGYIYICRYIYYKPKVLELYTTLWTTHRGLHVGPSGDPAGRNRAADAARAAGAAEPDGLQCFSQMSRVARHWEDMAQWKRGDLWILHHLSWWFMDIYGYLWYRWCPFQQTWWYNGNLVYNA